MKRYTNIPLKERKRNADKCYRHEEMLEEITMKKLATEQERCKTDKEQQEEEAFARLKSLAERR